MTKEELQSALERNGFGVCWPEIEIWLRDEVLLSPGESKYDNLPIGGTKQGGEPDLPPGFDWPKYAWRGIAGQRNTSKPMTFLMQLRCSDIKPFAPSQFPDHGQLSFFVAIEQNELVFDRNEQPIGRVLYSSDSTAAMLVRTPFPRGLYYGNRLPPCSLKIESSTGIGYDALSEVIESRFGFSQETYDLVWEFYRQEIIPAGCHKLFGPQTRLMPDIAQFSYLELRKLADEMQQEFQTGESSERNTNDELLLLEFDLTELPGDVLADEGGRLYYMIHRDDLTVCRFDMTLILHDVLG